MLRGSVCITVQLSYVIPYVIHTSHFLQKSKGYYPTPVLGQVLSDKLELGVTLLLLGNNIKNNDNNNKNHNSNKNHKNPHLKSLSDFVTFKKRLNP